MIHDPSPKFAGAGTLPLLSEARSNLRHNQYAPSCQPSWPGPVRAGPAQSQYQGSLVRTIYMLGQSSEMPPVA